MNNDNYQDSKRSRDEIEKGQSRRESEQYQPSVRKRRRVRLTAEQIQEAAQKRQERKLNDFTSSRSAYDAPYEGRQPYQSRDHEERQRASSYKEQYRRHREYNKSKYGQERTALEEDDDAPRRSYAPRGNYQQRNNDKKRNNKYRGNNRRPGQQHNPNLKKNNKRQRPVYENTQPDPEKPIRLNKYLAHSGVCSRREADELIENGAVLVNGVPETQLGVKVTMNDRIEVNGKVITPEQKVYVLLNKPRNCVTTSDDPQERLTVVQLTRSAAKERIYPVGRLDRNTTGVLLLTNDGDLAAKLVHPSFEKKKIYHVWLDREVSVEDMQKLADGVELEDGEMHADAISYVDEEDHTQVGIEIHSGRNRIVRRLFEHLGYRVEKLDRVYFAGLTKKNLGRGKWRYLTQEEVNNLKMGAFE